RCRRSSPRRLNRVSLCAAGARHTRSRGGRRCEPRSGEDTSATLRVRWWTHPTPHDAPGLGPRRHPRTTMLQSGRCAATRGEAERSRRSVRPVLVGFVVFAFMFGGALIGQRLRAILPEEHLSNESRDTMKLGIGLIATMTALVLG